MAQGRSDTPEKEIVFSAIEDKRETLWVVSRSKASPRRKRGAVVDVDPTALAFRLTDEVGADLAVSDWAVKYPRAGGWTIEKRRRNLLVLDGKACEYQIEEIGPVMEAPDISPALRKILAKLSPEERKELGHE